MSNVLIGIIGVILFIGLALAGALFLGPQFQQSTANSRAAAVTQAASQIGSATNLGNVQNGVQFPSNTTLAAIRTAGWLKEVPTNPVVAGNAFSLSSQPNIGVAQTGAMIADLAVTSIGTNQNICDAIDRQSGGTGTAPTFANAAAVVAANLRTVGCFRSTAALTGVAGSAAGDYIVYAKI